MQTQQQNELMKLDEVIATVRYSRPSIYRLMSEGKFPKPIRLGGRSVFWVRADIEEHIQNAIQEQKAS